MQQQKLTIIIPGAQVGSESMTRMGYWLRGHELERNNNNIIVFKLVKSNKLVKKVSRQNIFH